MVCVSGRDQIAAAMLCPMSDANETPSAVERLARMWKCTPEEAREVAVEIVLRQREIQRAGTVAFDLELTNAQLAGLAVVANDYEITISEALGLVLERELRHRAESKRGQQPHA